MLVDTEDDLRVVHLRGSAIGKTEYLDELFLDIVKADIRADPFRYRRPQHSLLKPVPSSTRAPLKLMDDVDSQRINRLGSKLLDLRRFSLSNVNANQSQWVLPRDPRERVRRSAEFA